MNGTGGPGKPDSSPIPWGGVRRLIREALREDIGKGDFTTRWIFPTREEGEAELLFREEAILAGLDISCFVWKILDEAMTADAFYSDGDHIEAGTVVARLSGNLRAILMGERTALNFLQRLTGIATVTAKFVSEVEGTGAKILDTRKTTPGLRLLEKYAVRAGGGMNHRFGLYDMILIKDNHIRRSGSLAEAFERIMRKNRMRLPVEVEVKNLDELKEALRLPVSRIMLDNMSIEDMRLAVTLTKEAGKRRKRPLLEASGNIDLGNVREVAQTGIDLISIGALTHSARAIDISLLLK